MTGTVVNLIAGRCRYCITAEATTLSPLAKKPCCQDCHDVIARRDAQARGLPPACGHDAPRAVTPSGLPENVCEGCYQRKLELRERGPILLDTFGRDGTPRPKNFRFRHLTGPRSAMPEHEDGWCGE